MAAVSIRRALYFCNPKASLSLRPNGHQVRSVVTTQNGSFLEQPSKQKFGLVGVAVTVLIGLWVGSGISRSVASFLEENDLFVPSDDDDDD